MSEIIEKWVAALRSGEYKQAKQQLFDDNTGDHCSYDPIFNLIGGRAKWEKVDLANKNDAGMSFAEIADLIEQEATK